MPQLMLRVADLDALTRARPDGPAIAALGGRDGWLGVSLYVLTETEAGRVSAHVRHFAPLLGVPEDPVTGSAAARARGLPRVGRPRGSRGGPGDAPHPGDRPGARRRGGGPRAHRPVRLPLRVLIGGRVVPLFEGRFVDG